MRCLACDKILTESEDARKFEGSGTRVSLCNRCVVWVPLPMVGGEDARVDESMDIAEPVEESDDPYED